MRSIFFEIFLGVACFKVACGKKDRTVVTTLRNSKFGRVSHGKQKIYGIAIDEDSAHLNLSRYGNVIHTVRSDDSEGLLSLVYDNDGPEKDYDDSDPLDLAGQHADLDFIINTVRKHKEKMLQKPDLYNKKLKRLDVALQSLKN